MAKFKNSLIFWRDFLADSHNEVFLLGARELQKIQNEISIEKKRSLLNKDAFHDGQVKKIVLGLQKGKPVAVFRNAFEDFRVFLGEEARHAESFELKFLHSIGKHKDLFKDQRITIVPTLQEFGILLPNVPSPVFGDMPYRVSRFASFVDWIISQFEEEGLLLIVGAGIDPIMTGLDLDDFADATDLKKFLPVLMCGLGLLQPNNAFYTAKHLSRIARGAKKIGAITANWSHSLERNDFPQERIQNTRSIKVVKGGKHLSLEIGTREVIDLRTLVSNTGLGVIFLVATSLRPEDFYYTGISNIISKARFLIVNCDHDYFCRTFYLDDKKNKIRGWTELFGHYTQKEPVRGKSISFLKIVEDANALFSEVRFPSRPKVEILR